MKQFSLIFCVLLLAFPPQANGDTDKGVRRRRLSSSQVTGPCTYFDFKGQCIATPALNPDMNVDTGLSIFAHNWIEYTCCNVVTKPLSDIIASVWLWLQVCTKALNTARGAKESDYMSQDQTFAKKFVQGGDVLPYKDGPLQSMKRFCPQDLDGGALSEWVVSTFFPVIRAKNQYFKNSLAENQKSVPSCKPQRRTGAVTIIVAEPKNDGTFGHFSMVVHDDDTLALPRDWDNKNYISFNHLGNTVGAMITGTKANFVGFGWDLKDVTQVLTLYNADTVAMKAKWEEIKESGQMFDLLDWNCARTALEVLNAGYPECTVKLEDQLWTPHNAWGYVNAMANIVNPDDKKPPSPPTTGEAFEMIPAETFRARHIKQQARIEQQIPVIVILIAIGSFVFNLILVAVVIWAVLAKARAVAEAKLERGLAKILLYVAANTGAWPGKKKRPVPQPSYVVPTNKDADPPSPSEPPSPRLSDHIIAHMDIGDHDGETDFEEFESWAKRPAVGLKPGEIMCVWTELDHDHDGKVTKQEWDRFMRKRKKLKWLVKNIKSIHKRASRMNAINEEEDEEEEEHIDEEEDDGTNELSGLLQEAPPPASPVQIKKELSNVSTDTKNPEP